MQRRAGERPLDRVKGLGPLERDGGAVRIRRAVVGERKCVFLAEEVRRGECDAPAGRGNAPGYGLARGHAAAAPGQRGQAHAGGIFVARDGFVPAGFAERQKHGGTADARAVVGHGDAYGAALAFRQCFGIDADAGSAGPACVLQQFPENIDGRG